MEAGRQVKVLYILGSGRNGSTILSSMLASLDGVTAIGEAHWYWDRGLGENRLCGCGVGVRDCPSWKEASRGIADSIDDVGTLMTAARDQALGGLAPYRLLTERWKSRMSRDQRVFLATVTSLYRQVASQTGSQVLVDSSKRPTYALLLSRSDELDVYALHLVRDSRAVAFSWLRKKLNPEVAGSAYLRRYNVFKSAAGWFVWNLLSELFWYQRGDRYRRIRYEDFIGDPEGTIAEIAEFVGISPSGFRSDGEGRIHVGVSHSIGGNPSRFTIGPIRLHADNEWVLEMRRRDRWIVTLLTWPQLLRYGYFTYKAHAAPVPNRD